MRQRVVITALLAVALFASGCGSSPDQKVNQAQIAIRNRKYDIALKLAEDVLKKQPDRYEALLIKAQAQLGLAHFDEAREALKAAIAAKPTDKEPHLLMITASLAQLSSLTQQTDFLTSPRLQKQFDDVLAAGMTEVGWLADPARGNSKADAEYQQARLIAAEADRIRVQWRADAALPVGDADSKRDHDTKVESDKQNVYAKLGEMVSHLNIAIKENPRHWEAAVLYARLLSERNQWDYLWEMLQEQAKQQNLPAEVVEREVVFLLGMPDAVHSELDRVALAKQLLSGIDPQYATTTPAKLTQARLALRPPHSDTAIDKARELLKEITAGPDAANVEARFILANLYLYQAVTPREGQTAEETKKNLEEAKKILDPLSKEMAKAWDVQLLYGRTLMEMGNNDDARVYLSKAQDLLAAQDPMNKTAERAWIEYLIRAKKITDAEGDVDKILSKDSTDPMANRVKYEIVRGRSPAEVQKFLDGLEKIKDPPDAILRLLVDGYMNLRSDQDETQKAYLAKAESYALNLEQRHEGEIDAELLLAETRLAQGNYDAVRQTVDKLSSKHPDAGSVNTLMGMLYMRRGMNDKAIEVLRKATATDAKAPSANKESNDARIRAHLLLAEACSRIPLSEEAIKEVAAARQIDPNNIATLALGARICDYFGNTELARDYLSHIDESKLDEIVNAATIAQIKLYRSKDKDNSKDPDIEGAAEVCRRAIAAGNHDPALSVFLAQIYAFQKDNERAAQQYANIVRDQPQSPAAWQRWAVFYVSNHLYEQGIRDIGLGPKGNDALMRSAQAMIYLAWEGRETRLDDALKLIQPVFEAELKRKSPAAGLVGGIMARIYLAKDFQAADNSNATARAIEVYQKLIDAGVNAEESRLNQIDLLWRGIKDEASTAATLDALDQLASKIKATSPETRYEVMRRYVQRERLDKAIAVLDGWIKTEPDNPTLHRWKGEFLLRQSEREEIAGKSAQMLRNQGDAIKELQQSVSLSPDDVRLHRRLGEAYQAIYDFPAAEKVYREAAKIDEGARILATSDLGLMFVQIGLDRQAKDTFAELKNLKDPRVSFALGRAYMALGDKEEAMKMLDKSHIPTFSPQYASAQVLLARLENRMGKKADARGRIEALVGGDARNSPAAANELLRLDYRSADDRAVVEDTTRFIESANLPDALRAQWLKLRLTFQDQKGDAVAALSTVDSLMKIPNEKDTATVPAARIALLIRTKSEGAARREFDASTNLQKSLLGPMAAIAVGAIPKPSDPSAPAWPLSDFLVAMAQGRTDDARAAVGKIRDTWGFYPTDMLKAMQDRPGSKDVQAQYARLCGVMLALQSGLHHVAISMAQEVADQNPKLSLAYAMMVQARVNAGEPLSSIAERIQKDLPDSALMLFLDARQKSGEKDFKTAVADLQKLSALEPQNADTLYRLSQYQFADGQNDASIESLRKVLSIPNNPYQTSAMNDLAYQLAEYKTGGLDEAYRLATQSLAAARTAPSGSVTVPALQDTLGWIEHKRGHDDVAQPLIALAVFMLSENPEVHFHMAEVYKARGNSDWAKYHYAVAKEAAGKPFAEKAKAELADKGS